ncbi:hypothetical protein CRG98_048767, partial [Punica granatum]
VQPSRFGPARSAQSSPAETVGLDLTFDPLRLTQDSAQNARPNAPRGPVLDDPTRPPHARPNSPAQRPFQP